jgi:hypothetical protein
MEGCIWVYRIKILPKSQNVGIVEQKSQEIGTLNDLYLKSCSQCRRDATLNFSGLYVKFQDVPIAI